VVEKLNGMFVFFIWDRRRQMAFGARDRLGIKPLRWAMKDGALIVSVSSFAQIHPVVVHHLLTFDYIPAPFTIRKGVQKLEPGSRFEWHFCAAEPAIENWSPPPANHTMRAPSEEEPEELVDRSVSRYIVSDVPDVLRVPTAIS
jgi:asparagine synthase (glutamine-hydrolysing)